jgi:hypothetical protein
MFDVRDPCKVAVATFVQGVEFRIQDLGCRVVGLRFRV